MKLKYFLFDILLIVLFFSTSLVASENCLIKGVNELNKGKFSTSAKILNSCEMEPVSDFILYYRAKSNLFSGNYKKANEALNILFNKYPAFPLQFDAKLLEAKTYFKQRKYREASNVLKEYVVKRRKSTFKDYMLFCNSLFMANEHANAKRVLEQSVTKIKKPADYGEIISWMKILKLHLDEEMAYTASLSLFESGRWLEANQLVEQYLKRWPKSDRLKILYGRLKYRFDELDEAINIFDDVRKHSTGKTRNSASNWLATVYAKMNDFDNAINIRRNLEKSVRGNAKLNLQHLIAFLYSDAQNHSKAIDEWSNLLTLAKKSSKFTAIAKWGLGWSYFKTGDYKMSEKIWQSVKDDKKLLGEVGEDKIDYWIARSYEKNGNKLESKKIFERLKNDNGYYGWMSNFKLIEKVSSTVPWPKHSLHKSCQIPNYEMSQRLISLRGIDEALSSVLRLNIKENSAYIAFENDLYDVSYSIGRSLFNDFLTYPPTTEIECLAWKTIYVRPYKKTIFQLADNILPESLIYGIMMSESSFVKDIESPVGAVGLMQIMPDTAEKIANSLGVKTKLDLTDPTVNISLGAYYLRTLLEKYPLYLAIASYNAGESSVERWMKNRKGWEIDKFIEDIPYKETREYVKKVLARAWNYERMNLN